MSTSDKDYIKVRGDLFNGQRVEIGTSQVEVLTKVRGHPAAAGFYELHFLDKDAASAEGGAYA